MGPDFSRGVDPNYEPEPENHRSRNGSDSAGNSDRLETRFEEIAANVEKLLSQVNLGSVSALETRRTDREKLGSALGESQGKLTSTIYARLRRISVSSPTMSNVRTFGLHSSTKLTDTLGTY